eukprot:6444825-Amphidinium_carterae.1
MVILDQSSTQVQHQGVLDGDGLQQSDSCGGFRLGNLGNTVAPRASKISRKKEVFSSKICELSRPQ